MAENENERRRYRIEIAPVDEEQWPLMHGELELTKREAAELITHALRTGPDE